MAGEALAAMAAQARRKDLLPRVLASLRPQVKRLCVYLNGWDHVPVCVRELADEHVLSPTNEGAERKLHWAGEWRGLYLSTDDDIIYPTNYVEVMRSHVERWQGRAIVAAHGRAYVGRPKGVHAIEPASLGHYDRNVRPGRFINHGGTGVMAWDAERVRVPSCFPLHNIADMQLAVWAQQNQVPLWLVPHEAHWFKPLALSDPKGIFSSSQRERHTRRAALLREQSARAPWRVFELT
jgi:hypothetical protein